MFTGIIEQLGIVIANHCKTDAKRLIIQANFVALLEGESIAINGVCLTLLPTEDDHLHFDVSSETLSITGLGSLTAGSLVNLERAMSVTARFGGHYVSGHVDGMAYLHSKKIIGDCTEIIIAGFTREQGKFLMPKGSVTIDGVSLTINASANNCITLMLVPHTLDKTTLGSLSLGQKVNIEFDYLTRIIAHQLSFAQTHCEEDV
jgi:riboflavin synthase